MRWLCVLAGALAMSVAVAAHAEDYGQQVKKAKFLTIKDLKARCHL